MTNLIFTDNTVIKILDSNENKSTGCLTIRTLISLYSETEIKDKFDSAKKDNFATMIKTTEDGVYVTEFENYTKRMSIGTELVEITTEKTKEIATTDAAGNSTTITVPDTVTEEVEVITVVLKYEDPTVKLVDKIYNQLNPTIDVEECTVDEFKAWQKSQIDSDCTAAIQAGVDVEFSDGNTYHFSYKMEDQINYNEMKDQIRDGFTMLPYHADNGDCTLFSAADMTKMITMQRANKTLLMTKCNGYFRMIDAAKTKDAISAITWGSNLNKKYQAVYDEIAAMITASM